MNKFNFKVHSILITIMIIMGFIRFQFNEPNILNMLLVIGWLILFYYILKIIFKKKYNLLLIFMILSFLYLLCYNYLLKDIIINNMGSVILIGMTLGVINMMLSHFYSTRLDPIYQGSIQLFHFFRIIFIIVLINHLLILIQLKFTPIDYKIICIGVPLLFISFILYFIGFIDNKFIKSYLVKLNTHLAVVKDNSVKLFIDNIIIAINAEISYGHILLFFGYFCVMLSQIFLPLTILLLFFIFFTYFDKYFLEYEIKYNQYKLSQPVFKKFNDFYYAGKSSSNFEGSVSSSEDGCNEMLEMIFKDQMETQDKINSAAELIDRLASDNSSKSIEAIEQSRINIMDLRQRYSILNEQKVSVHKLQLKLLTYSNDRINTHYRVRNLAFAGVTLVTIGMGLLYYNTDVFLDKTQHMESNEISTKDP